MTEETSQQQQQEQPVEIELGEAKFAVPPAVAAALKEARAQAAAAGESVREIEQRLTAQIEALKKPAPPQEDADPQDMDVLLFSNPKEAVKRIKAEIREEIRGEQAITQAQNAFWSAFYEEYPELKEDDLVVKAIMNREMGTLKPLKIEKAIKVLGEESQKYLLARGVKREKKKKQHAEGNNERSGVLGEPVAPPPEKRPGGISAILREAHEARRKAAAKGVAA